MHVGEENDEDEKGGTGTDAGTGEVFEQDGSGIVRGLGVFLTGREGRLAVHEAPQ